MDDAAARQKIRSVLEEARREGRLRSVGAYQRIFADYTGLVAEEYERISGREPTLTEPAAAPDSIATFVRRLTARDGGRYTEKGEIGRGGMAAIIRIRDQDLHRDLAMKVIPEEDAARAQAEGSAGSCSPRVQRFLEEAQITAQLDHPGIVPVHDLGLDESGRFFFTMKLVKGRTLGATFDLARRGEEGWSPTRAISVLIRVLEALAFAHEKGVIHRDLKPANVMVGRFGEVYVMDWGLAKILGRPAAGEGEPESDADDSLVGTVRSDSTGCHSIAELTSYGDILGTPAFMPPEQARGRIGELDARSDIYAVGAMMYQLLAGHAPYSEPGEQRSSREVLLAALAGPPEPIGELARGYPPELAAIATKAMERKPANRYPSAEAMAEDLHRFLENRVVRSYRTGPVAELLKWVLRNRAIAATTAAAVCVVVVLVVVFVRSVTTERNRAVSAEGVAKENERIALREKDEKTEALERSRAIALAQAAALATPRDPTLGLLLAREAGRTRLLPTVVDRMRESLFGCREVVHFRGHRLGVFTAEVSPAGDRLVTAGHDGTVRIWDLRGRQLAELSGHGDEVYKATWSPDGSKILSVARDGTGRLWSSDGRELAVLRGHGGRVFRCRFAPDGSSLVTVADKVGTVHCWEPDGSPRWVTKTGGFIDAVRYSRDGRRVLATIRQGRAVIRDAVGGDEKVIDAGITLYTGEFLPDGKRVLLGCHDGSLRIFDLAGRLHETIDAHEGFVFQSAVSPDGTVFATASDDRVVKLWSVGGEPLWEAHLDVARPCLLVFSPDGRRILAPTAWGGRTFVWDLSGRELAVLSGQKSANWGASFTASGEAVITASKDGRARLFRLLRSEVGAFDAQAPSEAEDIQVSPKGDRILTTGRDGSVRLFAPDGSILARLEGHENAVWRAVFSPEGDRILTASEDGTARLWTLEGECLLTLTHPCPVRSVALLPDAIATGGADGVIRLFDAKGAFIREIRVHREAVSALRAMPGGNALLSGSPDRRALMLDPEGNVLLRMGVGRARIAHLDRTADGSRIAVLGHGSEVSIRDPEGREIARVSFDGADRAVFSPDGNRLAIACKDGTVRFLDRDGNRLGNLPDQGSAVRSAAFSPDGRRIYTLCREGVVRTWVTRAGDVLRLTEERCLRELLPREREEYRHLLGPDNEDWIRAHEILPGMMTGTPVATELLERIRGDDSLSASVRDKLLALARRDEHEPSELVPAAFRVAARPDLGPDDYRRALVWVLRAKMRGLKTTWKEFTFGTLQVRTGAYGSAVAKLRPFLKNGKRAEAGAFLAMAHSALGQTAEALAALDGAKKLHAEGKTPDPEVSAALIEEAERALAKPEDR